MVYVCECVCVCMCVCVCVCVRFRTTSPCIVTHVNHTPLGRVTLYLSVLAVNALPRVLHVHRTDL